MIAGGKKAKHPQLITEKHKKPSSTAQREIITKNTEITTTTKYVHSPKGLLGTPVQFLIALSNQPMQWQCFNAFSVVLVKIIS